jgi:hypothetical protein
MESELDPFFGSGGDGFVQEEGLFARMDDDVHIKDSSRITGSDYGAGVVSIFDLFQNNSQVRLPEGKNSPDLFNSLFCRHRFNIMEIGLRLNKKRKMLFVKRGQAAFYLKELPVPFFLFFSFLFNLYK